MTLSWQEVQELVDLLAGSLADRQFDTVVGVLRSGLIPAVMLSHALGVRDVGVLDIRRTESDAVRARKRPPRIRGSMHVDELDGHRVLLVDDILGEGATIEAAKAQIRDRCASLTTAVIVVNRSNCPTDPHQFVDRFACAVHDWVVFPWEGKHLTALVGA